MTLQRLQANQKWDKTSENILNSWVKQLEQISASISSLNVTVEQISASISSLNVTVAALSATVSTISTIGLHKKWFPAKEMHPAATNGAATGAIVGVANAQNYFTLDFDPATDKFAFFNWAMPSSWNEGTITYRVVWSGTSTTTSISGDVIWLLNATAFSDGDDLGGAFGTPAGVQDPWTSDRVAQRSAESAAITVGGAPAANDLVNFRIRRNASNVSDTLNINAQLIGVEVFYTTDAAVDTA